MGMTNVRVFGSVRRGEGTEGIDIDLLVDASMMQGILDMAAFPNVLDGKLGVPIDVSTEDDLPARFGA